VDLTKNISRRLVRARLLGAVPRYVVVNPSQADEVGDIGPVCIVTDERVAVGACWVLEDYEGAA
jgi:hypothetical protein